MTLWYLFVLATFDYIKNNPKIKEYYFSGTGRYHSRKEVLNIAKRKKDDFLFAGYDSSLATARADEAIRDFLPSGRSRKKSLSGF